MKYTEFEAKVKEIDSTWRVIHNDSLTIATNSEGRPFVCVSRLRKYGLDTNYSERREVIDSDANMLMQLAYELAATPLEERKEPKKYYYRLIYSYVASDDNCLNYDTEDNVLFYGNKEQEQNFKTRFTRKEYEEIAKKHDIPADLHIEEEV
ncbi:hypothetical protein [Brochothrix thermosphacta]|uniref:hypothetical protein n=1 Tax=Brochothrix thermosphacta TaxID=2756 RepID=UPI000D7A6E8E|nr:hypothetical protein [Brochothrix thermosphacta]SPN76627.1 conserved hypothetical protein [Brochothrix thermosphacta]